MRREITCTATSANYNLKARVGQQQWKHKGISRIQLCCSLKGDTTLYNVMATYIPQHAWVQSQQKSRLHFHEPNFETLLDIDKKFEYWNWMPFNLFNFFYNPRCSFMWLIFYSQYTSKELEATSKKIPTHIFYISKRISTTRFYIVIYVFINSYHFKGIYLYPNLVNNSSA